MISHVKNIDDNGWTAWFMSVLGDPTYGLGLRFPSNTITFKQNYPPDGVARPDGEITVFFHKVYTQQIGQRGIYDTGSVQTGTSSRIERQQYMSKWQFACVAYRDSTVDDDTYPQASDILRAAAMVFQTPEIIGGLKLLGGGIVNVGQIGANIIQNDREQYESEPFFDLTVSHKGEFVYGVPTATAMTYKIIRV